MPTIPNWVVGALCALAIAGLFAAHAAMPFAFVPIVIGIRSLAGAANDLRRQRRLTARGQTVTGRVTEVWLEVVNRGRSGTIWRWRVSVAADVNGTSRSFVSDRLPSDPRPAVDVGTELAVRVDPATSTYAVVLPELPQPVPGTFAATSARAMRRARQRLDPAMQGQYGTMAGLAGACLAIYGWATSAPITVPFGLALLAAAIWFHVRAHEARGFERRVVIGGVTFQVPVLHVTRRHQASAFGDGENSWIVLLEGEWPDGHAQWFAVRTKDQACSQLRPGDLVMLQGDPVTRDYALA